MRIDMQGSTVPVSDELGTHVSRRVDLALRRFADRVESVAVRLMVLDASNRNRDKRCRIAARLAAPAPSVIVEATDVDAYVAVSQAAARLEEGVARSLSLLGREDDPQESA